MEPGRRVLATMVTTTTYGTWLPGDLRGYVDNGVILPGDPRLHQSAARRMSGNPVVLSRQEQAQASQALRAASHEFAYTLLAVSIESWHAHWLIDHGYDTVAAMVGRLKTRMRQALRRGRIWTEGFDKRFCFDERTVETRRQYIERHAGFQPL